MSELSHEAQEIRNFWKALKPEYALDQGPYIHPEDLAQMKLIHASETFSKWCMGKNPRDKSGTSSAPSVPQPFMGNLEDPKILIVTFNPGFQPFSDWVCSNSNSILNTTICSKDATWSHPSHQELTIQFKKDQLILEAIGESLKSWKEIPGQDGKSYEANLDGWRAFCWDEWVNCQHAILRSLGNPNEAIYPWDTSGNLKNILLPPPLNFRNPSDQGSSSMFKMSWHQEYFKLNKPNYIPSLFPKEKPGASISKSLLEKRAKSICQIEFFPYQSLSSKDITEYIKDPNDYLPSQKLLIRYIATAISTAERDGRIIIFRKTVANNSKYLKEIRNQAKNTGFLSTEILDRRLFKQINTKSHLTFKNLQHINAEEHYKNLIRSYTC